MTLLSTSEPLDVDGLAGHRQLLIAGNWQDASSGNTVEVINPSHASVITDIADADVEDGLAAVDAAAAALPEWAATPPRRRAEILSRCFELMTERSEQIAHLISLENGKALPTPAEKWRTPPNSSAGTPKKRSGSSATCPCRPRAPTGSWSSTCPSASAS